MAKGERSMGYQGKVIPPREPEPGSKEEREQVLARSLQTTHTNVDDGEQGRGRGLPNMAAEQVELPGVPPTAQEFGESNGKAERTPATYKRWKAFCHIEEQWLDAQGNPVEDAADGATYPSIAKAEAARTAHSAQHITVTETKVRMRRGPVVYEEVAE